MTNLFSIDKSIHIRFDLKSSVISRNVLYKKIPDLTNNINDYLGKYDYALKDLDLNHFNKKFYFSSDIRKKVIEQLEKDSTLLKESNLNDYSLLIGLYTLFKF